jgi:outer membrane protein OmpA-like peptidoglycan-associated protein
MHFIRLVTAAAAVLLAGAHSAAAQSNPNAQQIIEALKPTGDLSDTTRGIKPLAPGEMGNMGMPAGSAMSGPSAGSAPAAAPSTNLNIVFSSGSATLTPEATAELDQLGKALTSHDLAAYKFKIVGHTDTTGTVTGNQSLSEARADAVKQYLEAKFGVTDARLVALGVGESDPVVATPPQTSELRNRRVQIINLGQ